MFRRTSSITRPRKVSNSMPTRRAVAVSELIRELYRRRKSDQARQEFGRALEALRTEVARAPASKLSMRHVDREIAAAAVHVSKNPRDDSGRLRYQRSLFRSVQAGRSLREVPAH